jgi:Xaa-Pro aminopeptidase
MSTHTFSARRGRLLALLPDTAALVQAGTPPSRNYPANTYDYRASSHFLYLTGLSLPGAALLLSGAGATLYCEPPAEDDALWHGDTPGWDELQAKSGVDRVRPLHELPEALARLPAQGVGRLPLPASPGPADGRLAAAIIALRLCHDEAAVRELRRAAQVTAQAHQLGMGATRPGVRESVVRAAMEAPILAADFTTAYASIVTVRGEVLHNHDRRGTCRAGDLLLADVGAETDTGWAGDVTRTWPVSGRFSATQRAIYDIVLAAQAEAIAAVRPGVRYRDVHLRASAVIARGLVDEGLLRGDPDGLVERGAHALFFPHGIGHLLGLDVHDMEDLGDRAGYAPGRSRSAQFGLCYLRLDRDLQEGMAVTIEPGIYFVPSILQSERLCAPFAADLDRDRLARFADVRGIRIEDDVLVTATGAEVLTAAIPKDPRAVEAAVGA